jgi:hypothetical protein
MVAKGFCVLAASLDKIARAHARRATVRCPWRSTEALYDVNIWTGSQVRDTTWRYAGTRKQAWRRRRTVAKKRSDLRSCCASLKAAWGDELCAADDMASGDHKQSTRQEKQQEATSDPQRRSF